MLRAMTAIACAGLIAGCASSNFDPYSGAPLTGSSMYGSSASRNSTAGGPAVITAPPVVTGPAGCAGPISEYLQVIDNDAQAGHLNPGVYNRLRGDLDQARASCAAGREAEARTQLAAVKSRYGYR
jgi:hypothetical protein